MRSTAQAVAQSFKQVGPVQGAGLELHDILHCTYAMGKPLPIVYPGAVHHVTSRCNAQTKPFFSDEDRDTFLAVPAIVVKGYDSQCPAYTDCPK
jgi:hypothetical protein